MTESSDTTPSPRRPARPKRSVRRACVFQTDFVRTQIDPRVQSEWKQTYGAGAPFGNLRAMWSAEACARVNPYPGAPCPYPETRCAMAFLTAVQAVTAQRRRSPTGYFRSVARSIGIGMADNKPLAREENREASLFAQGPRDTAAAGDRHAARPQDSDPARDHTEPDLPRPATRPIAIGSLLGSLNFGPRQGRADDGKAGSVR